MSISPYREVRRAIVKHASNDDVAPVHGPIQTDPKSNIAPCFHSDEKVGCLLFEIYEPIDNKVAIIHGFLTVKNIAGISPSMARMG